MEEIRERVYEKKVMWWGGSWRGVVGGEVYEMLGGVMEKVVWGKELGEYGGMMEVGGRKGVRGNEERGEDDGIVMRGIEGGEVEREERVV